LSIVAGENEDSSVTMLQESKINETGNFRLTCATPGHAARSKYRT
jgi:azurin